MKKVLISIFCLLSILTSYCQDANFSQYNNSRLNTNPAFTGTDSTLVIAMNGRLQWPNLASPYQAINFSADKYIRAIRGGLGINYLYDYQMQGAYIKRRVDFNYAPHFELFKHKLALVPAFQISYFQINLDFSKLTYGDQIDPRRGFIYNTNEVPGVRKRSNVDISAGLLLYSNHFFGGVAFHHLTQPDEGMIGPGILPLKITIHGGANLVFKNDSSKNFILSPTLLYMQQQDFHMLLPGITAKYKCVSLGVGYRRKDAFITTLAFQNRFLRVGYSYDYTTSQLENKNTGGSHEIGLTWFADFRKRNTTIKTLRLI
ncbi:hypothetical protein BH10BAC1_BH10BAC1_03860 [soil metagenome]